MTKVIMFAFYGRRANIELQMPFIRHILAENADVEFDAWNLTREPSDNEYVRSLSGERVTVRNDLYQSCDHWNGVYRHYADPAYKDCVFIKLDDDMVFLESGGFGNFIAAIRSHPDYVVSSQVINNGASTPTNPGLNRKFKELGIPLLDVHMSFAYADMCHKHMFDNWESLIGQHPRTRKSLDWLSINCIGYHWDLGRQVAELVGGPSPAHIAGRDWPTGCVLGDEGAFNMFPRLIVQGFLSAHLTFGPQAPSQVRADSWRAEYKKIAGQYLGE